MAELLTDGEIDLHSIRHGLKLIRDTGTTKLFKNRDNFVCPVCEEVFVSLYASQERQNRFNPDEPRPFCVLRENGRFLLLTH